MLCLSFVLLGECFQHVLRKGKHHIIIKIDKSREFPSTITYNVFSLKCTKCICDRLTQTTEHIRQCGRLLYGQMSRDNLNAFVQFSTMMLYKKHNGKLKTPPIGHPKQDTCTTTLKYKGTREITLMFFISCKCPAPL